jgi:hypothetical protein
MLGVLCVCIWNYNGLKQGDALSLLSLTALAIQQSVYNIRFSRLSVRMKRL